MATISQYVRPNQARFVGIDGEGVTLNGEHQYVLLASSSGNYVRSTQQLDTVTCLEFLLAESRTNKGRVLVSFYFSYDVNMMLRSLPFDAVKELGRNGTVRFYDPREKGIAYQVDYIPRKMFTVYKYSFIDRKRVSLGYAKVYDVWGYFQSSFVKALRTFGVGTDILANIEMMKGQRSTFDINELDSITEYCISECNGLTELMGKIKDATDGIGWNIKQWHGAGSIANELLREYNIRETLNDFDEYDELIRTAYFGGRIQSFKIGRYKGVYSYDINSAYPNAFSRLPSFQHARIIEHEGYKRCEHAIHTVSWFGLDKPHLPVRHSSGRIYYPKSGTGSYYNHEIDWQVDRLTVHKTYEIVDYQDDRYTFVEDLYNERARLKREGNDAQIAVKLALNSLYGKFAQTVGHKKDSQGNIQKPKYQNLLLAGMITSITRGMIARAIDNDYDNVLCIATDGILITNPLDVPVSSCLGDWDYTYYESAFMAKSGVYSLSGKGFIKTRQRGFAKLDMMELENEYNRDGVLAKIEFPDTRFVGMKAAQTRNDWCKWVDGTKVFNMEPSGLLQTDKVKSKPLQFVIHQPLDIGESVPYSKRIAEMFESKRHELEYDIED